MSDRLSLLLRQLDVKIEEEARRKLEGEGVIERKVRVFNSITYEYSKMPQGAREKLDQLVSSLKIDHFCIIRGSSTPEIFTEIRGPELVDDYFYLIARFSGENLTDFDILSVESKLKELASNLDSMLWDTLQYIQYLCEYLEPANEVERKVRGYYEKILGPKLMPFISVSLTSSGVYITCAKQIKGRVIGKQGVHVKNLEKELGMKVRVEKDKWLTKDYDEKFPQIVNLKVLSPEEITVITRAYEIMKRHGLTPKIFEEIEKAMEEEPPEEEDYWE